MHIFSSECGNSVFQSFPSTAPDITQMDDQGRVFNELTYEIDVLISKNVKESGVYKGQRQALI